MLKALNENNGDVSWAARQAGICRWTHYKWMRRDKDYESKSMPYLILNKEMKWQKNVPSKRKKTSGYVYLVHCKETTFYKIGISKSNYALRLKELQTGCPFELEMVHVIHSVNYHKWEKELHNKFQDKWVRGEWFDLDDASFNMVMKYLEDTHQPQMQAKRQMQIDFQGKDHK